MPGVDGIYLSIRKFYINPQITLDIYHIAQMQFV